MLLLSQTASALCSACTHTHPLKLPPLNSRTGEIVWEAAEARHEADQNMTRARPEFSHLPEQKSRHKHTEKSTDMQGRAWLKGFIDHSREVALGYRVSGGPDRQDMGVTNSSNSKRLRQEHDTAPVCTETGQGPCPRPVSLQALLT